MTAPRPTRRGLQVTVSGTGLPPAARGLAAWLAGAAPRSARGAVDIAIVSDRRMRTMNASFRGVDKSTDVLSFQVDTDGIVRGKGELAAPLGDIAIAIGVATRQAREQGHTLRTELRVLALHGVLHLLGYDHERDRGEMKRVEERLRRRAGLPVGLIARAPRSTQP